MAAIRYLRSQGFTVETAVLPGAGHERHPEVAMSFFRRNWKQASGTMGGISSLNRGSTDDIP
jgi:hypothetical protein